MSGFTRLWHALAQHSGGRKRKAPRLPYSEQEWDATTRIAQAAARRLLDHRLNERQQRMAAAMVHYMVGASSGVAYAALARRFPEVRQFSGVMFGVALWLVADELLMPATGTTRKVGDYSLLAQANALGEHVIYAVTADTLLRV